MVLAISMLILYQLSKSRKRRRAFMYKIPGEESDWLCLDHMFTP